MFYELLLPSLFVACLILLFVKLFFQTKPHRRFFQRKKLTEQPHCEDVLLAPVTPRKNLRKKKPQWVIQEIIRLCAHMPHCGCIKIADAFNRLYEHSRDMTVAKSTVYNYQQKHLYDIHVLRHGIKTTPPKTYPKNCIWSMDLTTVSDNQKQPHTIFGVIDNGTRANLLLKTLENKASISLLRCLLDLIEIYGKPKAIRCDNEAVFTSRLFRFCLWCCNIKIQYSDIACPWHKNLGTFLNAVGGPKGEYQDDTSKMVGSNDFLGHLNNTSIKFSSPPTA
jgi:putative transposase